MFRHRPKGDLPKRFTFVDAVFIALLLSAGSASIPLMATMAPRVATIYRDNRIVAQYPLSSPVEFSIKGASGDVSVRIRDGAVSVVSSHCPRQICRHTSAIKRPFEQVVCVPNHILIEIRSTGTRRFDAIAR
jgi:hypothetical protein